MMRYNTRKGIAIGVLSVVGLIVLVAIFFGTGAGAWLKQEWNELTTWDKGTVTVRSGQRTRPAKVESSAPATAAESTPAPSIAPAAPVPPAALVATPPPPAPPVVVATVVTTSPAASAVPCDCQKKVTPSAKKPAQKAPVRKAPTPKAAPKVAPSSSPPAQIVQPAAPPAPAAVATATAIVLAHQQPAIAVAQAEVAPTAAQPVLGCPAVYFLEIDVWPHAALSLQGVEATHNKEVVGQGQFAGSMHVSKTHGGQFRKALAAGDLQRSSVTKRLRVSLIMTQESYRTGAQTIDSEQVLGDIDVTGVGTWKFPHDQLEKWDAIRVVAVNGDVTSPPRFRLTGVQEVRFFNRLPGKKMGEWDNNPVPDCIQTVHWIE